MPGGFVTAVATLEQQAEESLLQERLVSALAAIGLYGTMSYQVAARTWEIGVRIAIGAPPRALLWLVLRNTLMVVGFRLALAAPLVWVMLRLVRSELFGVTPGDPASITAAALALTTVALAAAYRPARAG